MLEYDRIDASKGTDVKKPQMVHETVWSAITDTFLR